jgi:hypothetical protein
VAELTSVAARVAEPDPDFAQAVLRALRWSSEDLDPDYPVRPANAGSEHLVLVTAWHRRGNARHHSALPVDVEWTPLVVTGVGLHADHSELMELLEIGCACVRAAATEARHD